jgi:hypothetical protein
MTCLYPNTLRDGIVPPTRHPLSTFAETVAKAGRKPRNRSEWEVRFAEEGRCLHLTRHVADVQFRNPAEVLSRPRR